MSAALSDHPVPADPPSPLTAEAEKQVRAMAADTYDLTGLSDPMYATTALLLGALRKTLATLDAARAPDAGARAVWNVDDAGVQRPPEWWDGYNASQARALRTALASSPGPAGRVAAEVVATYDRGEAVGLVTAIETIRALLSPAPAGLDVERLQRIETAAEVLLSIVNAVMPETAACGHDRRWLNSVLDDLRAATRPAEDDHGWEAYKDAFPAGRNIVESPRPAEDAERP